MLDSAKNKEWPLIGNSHLTRFLKKSISNGQVGGSYIFLGPDNLGKTTLARFFAQCLLCEKTKDKISPYPCSECRSCQQFQGQRERKAKDEDEKQMVHGDFHLLKKAKDKKFISVDEIRGFIKILSMSSFLSKYKVGIIKHADKLNLEAANALLKTMEEPNSNVVIILIVTDIESLPKTIVSRSQLLQFRPVPNGIIYDYLIDSHSASRSRAKDLSRLSLGRPALAIKLLETPEFYEQFKELARMFISFFNQNINERLQAIGSLINKKNSSQETASRTRRTIEIWEGVIRDSILINFNLDNRVQHEYASSEIGRILESRNSLDLIRLEELLEQAKKYLRNNVNPRLVLENIVINIDDRRQTTDGRM